MFQYSLKILHAQFFFCLGTAHWFHSRPFQINSVNYIWLHFSLKCSLNVKQRQNQCCLCVHAWGSSVIRWIKSNKEIKCIKNVTKTSIVCTIFTYVNLRHYYGMRAFSLTDWYSSLFRNLGSQATFGSTRLTEGKKKMYIYFFYFSSSIIKVSVLIQLKIHIFFIL